MNSYLSISLSERMGIDSLYEKRHSIRSIARKLSRAPSTISREIHKNRVNSRCYDSQEADKRAHKRRKQTRKKTPFVDNNTLKKTRSTDRPQEINDRVCMGAWEADTLIGPHHSSSCLSLVERKSRFAYIVPLTTCSSAQTIKHIQNLAFTYPQKFTSITVDNGKEFSYNRIPFKDSFIPVYFTFPSAPHEKGSVENLNKLIRRFLPKDTDFSAIPATRIKLINDILNHTPRKILGYKTPHEVFCSKSVAILI